MPERGAKPHGFLGRGTVNSDWLYAWPPLQEPDGLKEVEGKACGE
jgi:hypothetical protein